MPDTPDWSAATFEGNRQRRHAEFLALPLREKIKRIEEMEEVAARIRLSPKKPSRDSDGESEKAGAH